MIVEEHHFAQERYSSDSELEETKKPAAKRRKVNAEAETSSKVQESQASKPSQGRNKTPVKSQRSQSQKSNKVDLDSLPSMKVAELKELADSLGLDTGKMLKKEIIELISKNAKKGKK